MSVQNFKELIVWQRGIELAKEAYRLSSTLPKEEQYGLISQVRRAAVFIPSNIAEGHRRGTKKDFTNFLRMADGSAAELETQMILIEDMYDTDCAKAKEKLVEVQKMLSTMIKRVSAGAQR